MIQTYNKIILKHRHKSYNPLQTFWI